MVATFAQVESLKDVKNLLNKKNISFEEWQCKDQLEIRVDLEQLDEEQLCSLQYDFEGIIEDGLLFYTYLIFCNPNRIKEIQWRL